MGSGGEAIASIAILSFLLILGVPVPFCFAAAVMFLVIAGDYGSVGFLVSSGLTQLSSLILLAIPLYILAGNIMSQGGIAARLLSLAELFFGRYRSGLGVVVVVTTGLFGAISGTATSAVAAIGTIMIPRMVERGYDRGYASSLVASASILALMIPPSSAQLLYGWVTGTSILACFLAPVIPGILIGILLCLCNWVLSRKMPIQERPRLPRKMFVREVGRQTKRSVFALMMPFIVLGCIYGGITTTTEAAAIAVFYALPVSILIYRELSIRQLASITWDAAITSGIIMLLTFFSIMLARLYTIEQLPQVIIEYMTALSENRIVLLLVVNFFLLIVGMLMDEMSGILIAAPMLLPLMNELGVDPIQFSAIVGVNLGMGLLTPPTAGLLFFAGRVGGVGFERMMKPTLVFCVFAYLPVVIATTYFPWLSLALPRLVLGVE